MDFRLIGVFESSCPCRADDWDLEICPEPRFRLLVSSMPGPSTGQGLSELIKMTQDCSVALQRLRGRGPGFSLLDTLEPHRGRKGTARQSGRVHERDGYCGLENGARYNWLNDVVIDFYMGLVAARSNETPGSLRVHALTTHFFNVLRNRGYDAVRRWTDTVDLFSYDLVFVPIHDLDHWSLAVLNMTNQTLSSTIPWVVRTGRCYQVLMAYLRKEHQDKQKVPSHAGL
ncbi:sentrin-specific protease 2-like [Rhipicephalus sanguineus]|uniref:sentrin-specific protease 2-like n=1 Tax=Rhipicephalus sanguineus TaxID=34632 RepID=UPI0020C26D0E|nr:sentrin-specific protease 2-like [Rhipicephalus sanguineus]